MPARLAYSAFNELLRTHDVPDVRREAFRAFCAQREGLAARAQGGDRAPWAELDGWTRSRRHVLAFGAVIAVNLFYILLVDSVGFIPTGVMPRRYRTAARAHRRLRT